MLETVKGWIPDALMILGGVSLSIGAGMVFIAAGWIVAGVLLMAAGYVAARAS